MRIFFLLFASTILIAEELHQLKTLTYTLLLHKNPFYYQLKTPQGFLLQKGVVQVNGRGGYQYLKTINQNASQIQIELKGPDGRVTLEFQAKSHYVQINSQIQIKRRLKIFSPCVGTVAFNPGQTKILENGYDYYYDYYPRIISGKEKAKSNWGVLLTQSQQKSLFLGFLQNFSATSQVFSNPKNNGIFVKVQSNYNPRLETKKSPLQADPFILLVAQNPFQCLGRLARVMAKNSLKLGYYSWFGAVPDGWCSYQGGPDYGGYGENINEKIILENLKAMSKQLKPFGMENFQISQGWETHPGDWTLDTKKFPKGMKWLSKQIRLKGFIPGLIISPFVADIDSNLYRKHKNWFVAKSFAGRFGTPKECVLLDISKPEVKKFILENIRKVTEEWNFKYLRMDNNFFALFGTRFYQKENTHSQIFVQMVKEIRDALPEDVFLSTVGLVGLNYYFVHGMKSTIDLLPVWTQKKESWKGRGLKETYRIIARRYYFHQGFFLHDPDLIFFRSPLTWGQSLCYLQAVGYSGGVIKVGEPIASLKTRQINALGALLPSHNRVGIPRDLFEREYPECWTLPLENRLHVGFFNWGENKNLKTGQLLPAQSRQQVLDLTSLQFKGSYHAVEFWSESYLGVVSGKLQYQVPSQNVASITLIPIQKRPVLIHSNRHLFLLAPEETSYFEENRLCLNTLLIADFKHRYLVSIPENWRFLRVEGIENVTATQKDKVLYLQFQSSQTNLKEWSLLFEKTL